MTHSLSSIQTLARVQNLLNQKSERTAPLEPALAVIGRAIEVEHVCLYKLSADGSLLEVLAEWADEGFRTQRKGSLLIETIADLDADFDQILAEPIFRDSNFMGLLVLETDAMSRHFEPSAMELARHLATLLAPCLNLQPRQPSLPKLSPQEENISTAADDNLNILVVEDDGANFLVLERFIRKFGAVPHAAHNGLEAIERCKEMKYDLILMDLSMPKLDGFDATREIVTGKNLNRETPIVAVTADVTDGIERRCKKIGMQHYIAKPLRRDTLIEVLTELTKKKPTTH